MHEGGITKGIARWTVLGALFLIPLTPVIVMNGYFFPFITGKAFFFRILVEITVCAWVVLAFLDREYRPRFSWIGMAVLMFVGWMFIADLFAVNVAKAFWSNFERMEGWILLIHLLGFFFAVGAVLRAESKWRAWFLTSLAVSVYVVGYALLQLSGSFAIHQGSTRIDATLGNSAYLAIYFLFNVCIAGWLALTEKRAWLKWSLMILAVIETILIFTTETRGTVIGLVVAALLAAGLTALTAGKRARSVAVGVLIATILVVGGVYLARNSSFVQHNHVLQRVTSISLASGETRFTIWHMAYEGVLARPVFGWGQEGFNYVFNTYYDPSLYTQEQWFDRAHNAFIDWLSAGGIPAFLLYLSLFGTALVMLSRSSELSRPERIALTAALVGYAIHNLFVFDNLYSYIYFFAILSLIDSQVARPIEKLEHAPVMTNKDGVTYALPIAGVAAIFLIWVVNVPGMRVATTLITALSPSSSNGVDQSYALFKDLTAHPAFAGQEIREQLVSFSSQLAQNSTVTDSQKSEFTALAVSEMQKQVAATPLDAREYLELSYAYSAAGDDQNALAAIQQALKLSPKKEEMWVRAGTLEWIVGDKKAAQEAFNTAYNLGPTFPQLAAYAAAGDIAVGERAAGDKILAGAFGTTTVDTDALAQAYYYMKDWQSLIALLKTRVQSTTADDRTWFNLVAAYYQAGQITNAINTVHELVKRFPEDASAGAAAITQLQGGGPH